MLFWLLAALLLVIAVALVLGPLLGPGRRAAQRGERDTAVEVYRARLAELDEEHRLGMLAERDLAQARDELGRELLADEARAGEAAQAPAIGTEVGTGRRRALSALTIAVLVPALSLTIYAWLGDPGTAERAQAPPPVAAPGTGQAEAAELERMISSLAERLRGEPDNAEGWLLLARSYMTLERYAQATMAYAEAHRLLGDDATLLADMGQAEALAGGENFLGKAGEYLERALELDPRLPKALWLGGFAAAQRGERALAAERWSRLLENQSPDSDGARVLRELIARVASEAPAEATATRPGAASDTAPSLVVAVRLDDRLRDRVSADDDVFVFARAVDGPPMPLAVARTRVADLPATVRLDDGDAMAPGMKLSAFSRVVVGARVSLSGDARGASGDLEGLSAAVDVAPDTPVEVIISDVLP